MAGLAGIAADKSNVGGMPDALAFNLDRADYRFRIGLRTSLILAIAAVMIVVPMDWYLLTIPAACIALLTPILASTIRISALADPVLLIDREGIFDKRVSRTAIPWSKIRNVTVQEVNNDEFTLPNSFLVRIDVGSRRRAEIALVPWTYCGVRRYGIGWDDIVIEVRGLAVTPDPGEAVVASRIVEYAGAMLARYGRAGKEPFAGRRPGTAVSEFNSIGWGKHGRILR